MFNFLRDKLRTARLKARYQRLLQERLLELVETTGPQPVADDADGWLALGTGKAPFSEPDRSDLRSKARLLVAHNPHAANVLRLLEVYVAGPGLRLNHLAAGDPDQGSTRIADGIWWDFLAHNARHFSYREFARRTWRDGECFLRLFPAEDAPPALRFIDPELIAEPQEHPGSQGILTLADDVETPTEYLRIDPESGRLRERIPAEQVLHTRINADSNQKRGVSFFAPLLDPLQRFDAWLETELVARKLQASIVLWRRVQGSPGRVAGLADSLDSGAFPSSAGVRSERYRAGTILTTSQGTELKFLQPDTNFGDAVPLGRMLLLGTAAGAGLPEFMLTGDASNANFASTLVAEGPAVKLFHSEQRFFSGEFTRLWRMVMGDAVARGRLPGDFFQRIAADWSYPNVVVRDRPKEREADAKLVEAKVLSRAEVARRDDADPELMRREILGEMSNDEKQMTKSE